jgi:hypothetical protein
MSHEGKMQTGGRGKVGICKEKRRKAKDKVKIK